MSKNEEGLSMREVDRVEVIREVFSWTGAMPPFGSRPGSCECGALGEVRVAEGGRNVGMAEQPGETTRRPTPSLTGTTAWA